MPFGTFSALDTLKATQQSIADIGEDKAFAYVTQALDAHNAIMRENLDFFAAPTKERLIRGGSSVSMVMQELDEWGTPSAQKLTAGANQGFPLKRFGAGLQWTSLALVRMQGPEMAAQVEGLMDADIQNVTSQIKNALYRPTNYNDNDRFVDNLSSIQLPIKALQNADSFPIPPGPNGETVNEVTHTHYLVAAVTNTFAAADMDALIATVREHYGVGKGRVFINQSDSATVQAFPKFRAVIDARIIQANTATYVDPSVVSLDTTNTNNRMIGIYEGVEVWIKPWAIALYPICLWSGPGIIKPLAYRYDPKLPGAGNLALTFEGTTHGLKADAYERWFGLAAWNRIGAAILDVGHGTYTSPV